MKTWQAGIVIALLIVITALLFEQRVRQYQADKSAIRAANQKANESLAEGQRAAHEQELNTDREELTKKQEELTELQKEVKNNTREWWVPMSGYTYKFNAIDHDAAVAFVKQVYPGKESSIVENPTDVEPDRRVVDLATQIRELETKLAY